MAPPSPPKKFIRKLLSSKIFLFFAAFILIILVINLFRESYRKYQLTKEIDNLKSAIEQLEGKNSNLADMMGYFQQESYLEKEARLKLNLKKPGEKVVVLSDRTEEILVEEGGGETEIRLREARENQVNNGDETANYWKWWEYLFQY